MGLLRTVNGSTTTQIWDGDQLALELNNGVVTNKYLRGINLIAADLGGNRSYYLFNGHGDVTGLANTAGTLTKSYDYDAFGNQKGTIDPADTNKFRYGGEYWDDQTGTYYLRARYYNPGTGRFISEDSVTSSKKNSLKSYYDALRANANNSEEIQRIKGEQERYSMDDPLSLNLYTYCHNDPINYNDPSGHDDELIKLAVAIAYVEARIQDKQAQTLKAVADYGKYIGPEIADAAVYAWNGVSGWAVETFNLGSSTPVKTNWGTGFNTFSGLKKYLGSAGEGYQWHHIVEQSQIDKSGFNKAYINNTNNIIALTKEVHQKISAYYSSKDPLISEGKTVREWLAGKSFQYQYDFGKKVLERFGDK